MKKCKRILGIESSCDECSLSIVRDGKEIEALVVYNQLQEHSAHGGVVPELASRLHLQYIATLYEKLLEKIPIQPSAMQHYIDGIAVTNGPGLSGSLMIGLNFAKGLSFVLQKPLIGIDHILAHFYSAQLEEHIDYPHIGVVISGGHTVLAVVRSYNELDIVGTTLDDACGEAFEKVARELQLPYPGGPEIDKAARAGSTEAAHFPMFDYTQNGYNVSYSGLKTAVLHHRNKYWNAKYEQNTENIAATFQYAAIQMIVQRIIALVHETDIPRIVFGGGVACNSYLQTCMQEIQRSYKKVSQIVIPRPILCTDNAAMIAGLGYQYLRRNITSTYDIGVRARKMFYRRNNGSR